MKKLESVDAPLPSDIIIARHGQYPTNIAITATGEAAREVIKLPNEEDDAIGLTEVGQRQARCLGQHLLRLFPDGFTVGMSSDFARATETAQIALPTIENIVIEPALRERDRGDIARMAKVRFEELYPEEIAKKIQSPLGWRPPNGETLREKATALRGLLPIMGILAPDQPFPVITSGEVVIAARSLPELGNMDDVNLKRGLKDGWPALAVDNAQFDHYTRFDLETNELGATFNYMRSVRAHSEVVIDSGWMRISR